MLTFSTQRSYWQQEISRKEVIFSVCGAGLIVIGIAILFYSDLRMSLFLIPVGLLWYKNFRKESEQKKKRQFEQQFQNALQSLQSQLNVGYSMENGMKEVQKELRLLYPENEAIVREFTYMVRQLNLNFTAEQVWTEFAHRVGLAQVDGFVTVFVQAKRSGGDSISIIRNAIKHMRDRAEIQREIETVIAAKKLEFQIMTLIPFGIIAYMRASFPEFMNVLYGNLFGKCFMSICLVVYLAAWKLGRNFVEIEV